MRFFWKLILKIMGWETEMVFPKGIKKCVVIVAPHTSAWDYVLGLATRSILRIGDSKYLGKKELFTPPFGWFFTWMGGIPVDRNSKHNVVDQVVEQFNNHDSFIIGLSPEGTRKKVEKLKTGFYNIAKQANVPIVMIGFDFEKKKVIISNPFYATENQEADFENILHFFRPIKGKNPELGLS